jgi:hypothetical protein
VHFLVVFRGGMVVLWSRGSVVVLWSRGCFVGWGRLVGVFLGADRLGVVSMGLVVFVFTGFFLVGRGGQGDAHKGGQNGCEDEYFHF